MSSLSASINDQRPSHRYRPSPSWGLRMLRGLSLLLGLLVVGGCEAGQAGSPGAAAADAARHP